MISDCPHCALPLSEEAPRSSAGACPSCGGSLGHGGPGAPGIGGPGEHSIGRFELLGRVGVGAFGTVWKARDTKLGRPVALKVLHPNLIGSASDRERFFREAQTAAQLRHPGIVPVYEVAELNGMPVIVSAFVLGTTLSEYMHGHRPSYRESARIILQISDALEYAHSMGVVHRDVKPSNVMVESPSDEGSPAPSGPEDAPRSPSVTSRSSGGRAPEQGPRVLVLDFGLALRDEIGATLTTDGQLIGTPAYMSPEQANGKGHDVDRRSDIYSLGVILYELICGSAPFRGHRAVLLEHVIHHEPRPPRKIDPAIPRDLESICLKAMAKSPRSRYPTARAFAGDLHRFLDGSPVSARPVGALERSARWCRRNPTMAGLVTAVGCLLLAVAIVATLSSIRLNRERSIAVDSLWHSYLAQARAIRLSGQPGRRFDGLDVIAKAAAIRAAPSLRDEAIATLPLVDVRVEKTWRMQDPPGESINGAAFDERLERCAVQDQAGNVVVFATEDSTVIARLPDALEGGGTVSLSPNGRMLSVVNDTNGRYIIVDLAESRIVADWRDRAPGAGSLHVLTDRRAVIGQEDGTVVLLDLPSGAEVRRIHLPSPPYSLRIDPSEQRAAVQLGDADGATVLLDLDTGVAREFLPVGGGRVLAWDPSGTRLVLKRDMDVETIDLLTQRRIRMMGHQSIVTDASFNPQGDLLATRAWDGTTRLWDPLSGKEMLRIPGHFLRFDASGDRLAFIRADETGWWRVAPGRECRTLFSPDEEGQGPWSIAGHPGGRLLVTAHDDGARIWDRTTGRMLKRLPSGWSRHAVFDSSGAFVLTAGEHGVQAWPETLDDATGELRTGPPRVIVAPELLGGRTFPSFSATGRWLVAPVRGREILVVDLQNPTDAVRLGPHPKVSCVAVSPDGRWVVSGAQFGRGVKVWDVRRRELCMEVPTNECCGGAFSPDGRWLITTGRGEGVKLWRAPSWKLHLVLDEKLIPMGNAVTGRFVPLLDDVGAIRLLSTDDGRELARLLPPDAYPVSGLCFDPRGEWLAVSCYNLHRVQVWDLAMVRDELAGLGIGWE